VWAFFCEEKVDGSSLFSALAFLFSAAMTDVFFRHPGFEKRDEPTIEVSRELPFL
jgi:hypothetical protein